MSRSPADEWGKARTERTAGKLLQGLLRQSTAGTFDRRPLFSPLFVFFFFSFFGTDTDPLLAVSLVTLSRLSGV